ncbi:hypothetical protein E5C31_12335 [Providencia rettgeri]|uniref:Cytochrome c domain-containing protein n=1 Tax=Alcaligenes parafaecalis TaxID=171260 RepID=A0ABT3VGW4_9BURK|nr:MULTISPECIES: c-type cytochrome [Alcaligenes]MBY6346752.1 hypothetical protein [Providencia rettgeri]MCX5462708.1 hypothetical protein [Alcaligenes parafaecalis]QTC00171.1 hypothetical protein JYG33_01460 [Alcaligenes sp. SORT26]
MSLSLVGRLLIAPALLAASSAAAPVWASSSTLDIKTVASSCANCHGPDGRSTTLIPSLAGRPEATLLEQLRAFASDKPPAGTTIMNRLVKGYQDADLEALARYFSEVSSTPRSAAEGR